MTVSIALCTYNGARYLQEQLDSIAAQTRLPDEMVVCDDGSTDETVPILQNFAAHAPFPVQVVVNPSNLGSTQNFAQAISLCRHDLIFLSDQDDVWRADKIETMHAVFAAQPEVGLVFTDADVVDEHLQPQGRRLWAHSGFGLREQRLVEQGKAFDLLRERILVTGATLAFCGNLRPLLLPFPRDAAVIHDGWIALMSSAVSKVAFLEMPLVLYRQHEEQQIGASAARPAFLPEGHYQAHVRQLHEAASRLSSFSEEWASSGIPGKVVALHAKAAHIQTRLSLPRRRVQRLSFVLSELIKRRYHRYSNGWRSAARDLW